jgi:hypothetical protein
MPMIGVQPIPAEISTSGASLVSRIRSPNGGETVSSSPSNTFWCRKFETSPAGRRVPSASTRSGTALTVIPQAERCGARVRLYWRICRAPSASVTTTEMYWPGKASGSVAPPGSAST